MEKPVAYFAAALFAAEPIVTVNNCMERELISKDYD